ncbi:Hypp3163 [Branchiostoma lanceolatum]|uniref:Hypp3163 protein n=1 Tax=Branchiostoma lanceolatum TaxID=7740 RepID=A0A8K0ETD3_BRALA|nr:Hypp3163 [Branchiostoma lanceolatum]
MAILAVAFLGIVCTVTLCCKNAFKREEDLSRAMGSDGYVATYVDGTTLSSPGRARGRTQANAVNGTVVHPTVHVHPRSSDHHSNSSRTEPPTRGFSPADPPPFAPPPSAPSAAGFFPSAPPTQGFPPSDPPPFAPPPLVPPTHYQGGTTPPVPSAAHGQPPFSDEPPPYDVATMFPTVDPQNR